MIAIIIGIICLFCLFGYLITNNISKPKPKPTELNLCCKCKYYTINNSKQNICTHPNCITYDLVTGTKQGHVCDLVRKYPSNHYTFPTCGKEGKWFEPKENEKEINNETL